MTMQEVRDKLASVRRLAEKEDHEMAHVEMDELYISVLRAIATGQCQDEPPEEFASLALTCEDIQFDKWFA